MNRKKLTIVECIIDIVLIIFLSIIFYLQQPIVTSKVIYIPKGSINHIISYLNDRNYDIAKIDAIFLRFFGSPQSGWIDMKKNIQTKADFLMKLTKAKAALRDITLIPGETTYIFLNQIAKKFSLNKNLLEYEFKKQSLYQEGAFIAETYSIPVGVKEKEIIHILLNKSYFQKKSIAEKFLGKYNEKDFYYYITIASVIQKEAANRKEMPIISSVIYNRLKKGMKLQMDGTLNYGKYSHLKVTKERILNDNSFYNTYKYRGIPKEPVCNVSVEAIIAAMFPAQTNYLYFMKNRNGVHDFSCNYSTHLDNIKRATK